MRKAPYNVAFQEGTWAITERSKDVKDEMRANNIHPNNPWIIHYCNWRAGGRRWWNVVLVAQAQPNCPRCSECGKQPPDKITTIWRLYV
jgi:hypothetical protein